MNEKNELQKVSEEVIRFMRGRYALDEVPGKYYDINCLKFKLGKKTILSINIYETHYDFQIIFGKVECEKFEKQRQYFSLFIQDLYDKEENLHDGKWLLIRVEDIATLEEVKKLILIKKNPNRKPFPKVSAIYADCGHRCDLCVHYIGGSISDEFREELKERITHVYCPSGTSVQDGPWGKNMLLCKGCNHGGIDGKHNCDQKKCAISKTIDRCVNCNQYPCSKSTVGWPPRIELKHVFAKDVTWAILPFVDKQYGN